MATRPAGRSCWAPSPAEEPGRRGAPGAAAAASPPVLALSHFCRAPFLCFGDVRVGASRALPLVLHNPNEEAADVRVPRFRAAALGFSVAPSRCVLQPKEKIVISVNWTPLKEGRVREVVTFLVNNILKHQAVILGNAEEQKKKKRSLWDTISKKKIPASSSHNKKVSKSHSVNKTFSISQKVDRVRSPLQACENLAVNEGCSLTENNSLTLEENKIPISPISPAFKEYHSETCLPLFLRRSTAYSSRHASENGEQLKVDDANISKDLNFNEEVITETCYNSINISGQGEENSKLILTPRCSSTLDIMQSQGHFLSPDSFVNNNRAANNDLGLVTCLSSDAFMKDNSKSVCLESKTVQKSYQTILSPDSFLNDNYGLNKELESESVNPIVSPNQFPKGNTAHICISQQICKASPLPNENSQMIQSSQDWRKKEDLPSINECQDSKTPEVIFEEPVEIKSDYYSFTKQNHPKFSAVQDVSTYSCNKQPKKRPVLSATVIKRKPTDARKKQTDINIPKAKRSLNSAVDECEKVVDNQKEKEHFHSYLPVIGPALSKSPSTTAVVARKRKSDGNMEDSNMKVAVTEHTKVCEIKRIHISHSKSKTSTVTKTSKVVTPISKRISNREKLSLKKKTDLLVLKTPISKTNKRMRPIVGVAQSNLTFIKPLKANIPRHPMPFAAKNVFYDERWKEKQEQGFTWWLNFILTPDDFTVKTSIPEVNAATLLLGMENQHKISVARAPTKEEMSLRAYTARCRLNRLRRTACRLFTSEKLVKAIKKLEIEIEVGRLIVRKDRHLWKDVGERQKVLNWLLSYNPLWLRIGLETIYGELISLEDNSDVTGLAVFILNRLLWNPDIAAEYRHPTVPHLYRDGHEEALSKFTLKKLLLLVCFLDHAKMSRLIDHDPCLFCKDAEFKASKDVLLAFSRDFLSGEGDLSRHLSLLGFPVSHIQTPFDEFDFAVTNLAVDLQCGVRLVRTVELLTQSWNLSKKLRVPAISRLQKMHNVDIVLEVLKSRGIPLSDEHGNPILSKDIVDRHREKTLGLLWKIAFAFQVDISLNLDQLKEEIDFLKHTHSIKKAMSTLSCHSDAVINKEKEKRNSNSFEQYSESVKLLMDWVNAVCAFYNKKVENFTVSFSDGRVLCYLIHHYHPCYVPFEAICQRTTQTVECTQTGSVVLNSSSESDDSNLDMSLKACERENISELHKDLLENEKRNFHLVRSAVRDLGGIPAMVHHSDMSNTIPDEKVVITYLSFLCSRLLDLRKEIRAARLIQTTWRKYKLKKDLKRHQERDKAARVIQSAIINFLTKRRLKKEASAALVIQKHWRRVLAQRKLLLLKKEKLEKIQNRSASVIQRYWRRYSTRKRFLKLKHYSIILQSRIRMIIAVTSYKRYLWATVTLQRHWRACLRRKHDQQRYKMLKSSSIVIQSMFRRWKRRKTQLQTKAAITLQRAFREWYFRKQAKEKSAVVIQSWYRMHKKAQRYTYVRSCAIVIQRRFRCFQAQKLYRRKRESILTIQRYWRACLRGRTERANYLQKRAAAVRLQAAFRRMKARSLQRRTAAARVLQSHWRMRQARARFLHLKKAVIKLQARVRRHQQVQKYRRMKKAALIIQTHFRAHVSAKKVLASYKKTRTAAIIIQSAYRGMQARRAFIRTLTSVIKIQSCYRAYSSKKKFQSLKRATIKLQSLVRMKQRHQQYLRLRAAALFVQRRYRSQKLAVQKRKEYVQLRGSCVTLQAFVRGWLVRRQLGLQRKAAASLQSHFRMRKTRQHYLRVYKATVVIQNYYRAHAAQVTQRRNFLQVKRAATCLQAAYRGHRVRQLIKQQSAAALKIQTAFRGHRTRVKYQSVLQSAIKIQRWYRARKTACGVRTHFLKTKVAVVALQAAYRGWRVRKQIRRAHQSAVKIQSTFRMAKAQKQFRSLKRAASVIQQHLRARRAGTEQRLQYLELRHAALVVQAAWRGRAVRRQIRRQHSCAAVIQTHYRMHVQRKQWKARRRAALLILTYYRAHRAGKDQRRAYLKTRAATVLLQSAYRGMKVRQRIKDCHKAAVIIQSKYRAHATRKKYVTCRTSAIAIQRWYRSIKMTKLQHEHYLNLKQAAIKIQALYRGLRVRRHIQHMHTAATSIQAMFRMHRSRVRYHAMRRAAVAIQVRYRAYYRGKTQRERYLETLKAVHTLQASFRGARVRRSLRRMQTAATLIQSHYRRHRQQTYFNKLRKVTRTVQQRYRAVKERNAQLQRYKRLRHCVARIQATFRGVRTRRHLKAVHLAATLIQRRFRAFVVRRTFLSLRKAVIWIQRRHRANLRARHGVEQFLRLRKAVITIQSSYRGRMARKKVQEMHRAATALQAAFRMHRARARYQALRQASLVIQMWYRAGRAARLQRRRFLAQRCSALVLQAAFRGMRTRRHLETLHSSAACIQSRFRSLVMRRRFVSLRKAAIVVQRRYRATVDAKRKSQQLLQLRKAAITIQASYRGLIVRRQLQEMQRAAVLIQATFRMHRTYVTFQAWKRASLVIQQRYRARRTAKLQRANLTRQCSSAVATEASCKGTEVRQLSREEHRAAVLIQSTYRMYRQHCFYQKLRWAAKVIQEKYRTNEKQKALQPSACKKEAACIQASLQDRNIRTQTQKQHEAATVIQKHFKAFKTRKRYLHLRATVISLQRRYRALAGTRTLAVISTASSYRGCKTAKDHVQRGAAVAIQKPFCEAVTRKPETPECAALRIQSFLRMAVHRKRFVAQKRAAVTLQCYFRTWQTRKQFLLYRKAAVIIQNHHRAFLSAKHQRQVYLQIRSSIIFIQARTKGFIQKRKFQKMKKSTIKIQRWFRARLQRKKFIEKYSSITKIEEEVQEHLNQQNRAASVIQKAVRHFLVCKRQEKLNRGITKIQALWRGYSWRKKNDCTKIKAIRLTLQAVNREVQEENKLYRRTELALHYLLTYKHFSAILEALKHLEVVTRLSPLCCEHMAESGAIAKILVLIRSCNRSVPCMEVIRYAVQVLLNLAKYEKTTPAVYDVDNCVDTLLDLLQMYREKPGDKVADKSGSIFTKTCCLLALLLKATNRASDVRSRSRVVDRIYSLYKLTAHQHKMNSERTLCKQKRRPSVGIPFIPETPVRTRIVSRLKPDWVLRRDNMEEITNSLQAIQMVMDTLGIPY